MTYCSNCGTAMADDALFCPECGTRATHSVAAEPTPVPLESGAPGASPSASFSDTKQASEKAKEIQHFLKISLPDLTKKILFDPIDGTKKALGEIKEPVKIGLYCVLICSLLIPLLVYIRIPAEARQRVDFVEFFFKGLMLPLIGALIITSFSFIMKAINNSNTANFGNEILTGGIVSIGYALFVIIVFFFSYLVENSFANVAQLGRFGDGSSGPPTFTLIMVILLNIYLFLITSNSLSQSLRSSGIKDGTAFYLSPLIIVISAYLTIRIWFAIFVGSSASGLNGIFNPFN